MSDQAGDCGCGTVDQTTRDETSVAHSEAREQAHWIEAGIVDSELPDDFKRAMGAFLGERSVETIDAFFEKLRSRLAHESLTVEDLCHAEARTPHWGERDGKRYHFQCFYDAVVLAEMTDAETRVRTESPDGTVIEGTATGSGEFSVQPPGAVMSFGVQTEREQPVESIEELYAATCPYVKAFSTRAAYERWAATVPAVTVATSMADGTDLAQILAE